MITILDGPVGTQLAARGVELTLPLWSAYAVAERPEVVASIHAAYVSAGATVHRTATFRTTERYAGAEWEALARKAAALARSAVPRRCRIAGSIAPIEDCYLPALSPKPADARKAHRALAQVLADEALDLIICETFANVDEAVIAVEEAVVTGLETWISFTAGPDGTLMTPAAMAAGARQCIAGGAKAVLVNCTAASKTLPYVEALSDLGVPVGAYANAGRLDEGIGWAGRYDDETEATRIAAHAYGDFAGQWVVAGASIVGSCCGTGPAHIRELASRF